MTNVPGLNLPKGVTINNLRNWTSITHKENFYMPTGNPIKDFLEGRGGWEYEQAVTRRGALLKKTGLTKARMNNLCAKWWQALKLARQVEAKRSPSRSPKRSPSRSPTFGCGPRGCTFPVTYGNTG